MKFFIVIATILLVVVLGFLGFMVVYQKGGGSNVTYSELVPIIGLNIAVIAIIIGLFSILGGLLFDKFIQASIKNSFDEKSMEWSSKLNIKILINTGYVYYKMKDIQGDMLNLAISETERVLGMNPNEYLECFVKNNLAFYYAERGTGDDEEKAEEYSEFVFNKSSEYFLKDPEAANEWKMTRAYIMARNIKTKAEAKRLYEGLSKNPTLLAEQKDRIKKHMDKFWPT